jgi:hypothetical protein
MSDWMQSHWYLLFGAAVAGAGALCLWFLARQAPKDGSRSILSYVLLWPLIFDAERAAPRKTRVGFVEPDVCPASSSLASRRSGRTPRDRTCCRPFRPPTEAKVCRAEIRCAITVP